MSVDHRRLTWTMLLLFLPAALCATWKVKYQEQPICAVTGSSVVILCSFYHQDNLGMTRVMWSHLKPRHLKARLIFDSNLRKVAAGFQYIGDKHSSCSLKIHSVTQSDAGKYIIALNNNRMDAGPRLKVVDLKILVAKTNGTETMKKGDSVNLTCVNRCKAHDLSSAFNWFKDGEAINEGRVLSLSNISSENSGNYTCSLKTQAGATSGAVNIDVEYAPLNTTVSVRPSADVDAHSNLTLVCSSRSNPPVEHYTWFKMGDAVVEVGHQPVFITGDRGQYLCSVSNRHGSQNSSAVTLQVRSRWASLTRDLLTAVTVALIAMTVIAVRRLKETSTWAPQTDCGKDTQKEEKSEQEGETPKVVYATLNFNNTMKSDTGQHMDIAEEVTYSTVCHQTVHQ